MPQETRDTLHRKIERLKEQRAAAWRALLPDDVNNLPVDEAQSHARAAERHPSVTTFDDQMMALRARWHALPEED